MKTHTITLSTKQDILFYIGESAGDNMIVIEKGNENDYWFHAKDSSSCHVVAIMPEKCTKKEKHQIIKAGARLCKQYTNKLRTQDKIMITYTKVKHVSPALYDGSVNIEEQKQILI
ncbi:MAG: DUF814 domain-containing protein [Flavobacteriaceae bacterium]|nr:DUF814 domain-containing protein [Flavobacteriaceae bacterium]